MREGLAIYDAYRAYREAEPGKLAAWKKAHPHHARVRDAVENMRNAGRKSENHS